MTRPRAHLVGLVAALLSAGCSSTDTGAKGSSPLAHKDSGGTPEAAPQLGPYPAGPYGNKVGDTLTNLLLQGYLNEAGVAISNTLPWLDAYSLEDVRATGAHYALVHVSEFL